MINFSELKKFLFYNLIGIFVISALVAVVTILTGEFNEIMAKIIGTMVTGIIHSILSLFFIWNDERTEGLRNLSMVHNTVFIIIVLSFITSLFGIWEIFEFDTVLKAYLDFGLLIFTSVHVNLLWKALGKEKYIDMIVKGNYAAIAIVLLLFQPIIFADRMLDEFFYRFLGAFGIIDVTLTILTAIFYLLYLHKHPELQKKDREKTHMGLGSLILMIIVGLFLLGLIGNVISSLFYFL